MPVEIFLSKANAEPEYETIDEEDLLDTDEVVEHIEEEKKEGEEGEPKKKVKIVKRPVSISDTHPLWAKNPSECTKDEYIAFLPQGIHGLQGASVLDPSEHGLSV